jgi:hypothetical protein
MSEKLNITFQKKHHLASSFSVSFFSPFLSIAVLFFTSFLSFLNLPTSHFPLFAVALLFFLPQQALNLFPLFSQFVAIFTLSLFAAPLISSRISFASLHYHHPHHSISASVRRTQELALWCVVGGCYTLISVVLLHHCLLGLLVSAPSLLCEGRGFELSLGRGKTTMLTFGCTLL